MKKIHCDYSGDKITVKFFDYKNENQLKDFYKIYKKASGTLVLEYIKNTDETIVKTNNDTNSVGIGWSSVSGCTVFSNKTDRKTLIGIVFGMLCYRYANYSQHAAILAEILDGFVSESTKKEVEDDDAKEDVKELLATFNR